MVYWTVPFSMTLNDPYPRFQGQAIFHAEYLRNCMIYRHSVIEILIGTYTRPTQQCPSKIFSDKKRCAVCLQQLSFLSLLEVMTNAVMKTAGWAECNCWLTLTLTWLCSRCVTRCCLTVQRSAMTRHTPSPLRSVVSQLHLLVVLNE